MPNTLDSFSHEASSVSITGRVIQSMLLLPPAVKISLNLLICRLEDLDVSQQSPGKWDLMGNVVQTRNSDH